MAINERLIDTEVAAAGNGGAGTGNQEEGLILHLDANDVDSYDGDGAEWVDITDHEYTPATNVSEHFNTIIWGGDASTDRDITGVGFAPDLVWIKRYAPNYGGLRDHRFFDTLRGAGKVIYSSGTYREATPTNELNGFLPDGFNIGNSDAVNANVYGLEKYVAWCFKAGGAPSGSDKVSIDGTSYATMSAAELTDGTEPIDKLSVNTKLGFSIVKYTAPALTGDTVAHGLGESPEMIILKSTSVVRNWNVFHKDVGLSKNLHLNTTDSANTGEYWTANPSTFSIQDYSSSSDWIAYCFASKRGVSKVGSFIGTGAAGNKIYTGFEPAFILTKRTSTSGASWSIIDNKRSTDSDKNDYLAANTTGYEITSSSGVTFNRDGFTLNGGSFNTSSQTHIYYAVAKNTNETSLIPDTDLELHLDADSFPQYGEAGYSNTPSTWTALTGSNGTITGTTFDSELGNYLNIASDSDYVDVSTANMLDSDFTIEMWYNLSSIDSNYRMFLSGSGFSNGTGIGHYAYGSTLKTWISIGGTATHIFTSPSALIANKWQHIVLKREGTTWTQYIDGELLATATGSSAAISSPISRIGRHYNVTGVAGTGKVGQARIYSSALTQDQIRQNYNFTKPSYPNGNDGTISGITWNSSGYFDFDGSNDKVTIASTATSPIDFTAKNYTIGCWINPDTSGVNQIFTKYGSSDSLRSISVLINTDNTLRLIQKTSTTDNSYSTSTIPQNTWTHIVVVRSSSDVKFYINGELDNTVSNTFTPNSGGNQPILIGTNGTTTPTYFNGQISDVKLYDKALSAAEVTAQFAIKQFDIG